MASNTSIITLQADAVTKLSKLVAAESAPKLTNEDLIRILEDNRLVDVWEPITRYILGDRVVPTEDNRVGLVFKCVFVGDSGSEEPSWLDVARGLTPSVMGYSLGDQGAYRQSLPDGTTAWLVDGPHEDLWNLDEAAYQGWMEKATRVAGLPSSSRAGNSYNFGEVYRNCIDQANRFGGAYIK